MIKALICCGGGFSSSAMARKAQKDIIEKGLSDKISIEFLPFSMACRDGLFINYDICLLCPHLKYSLKDKNEKFVKNQVPLYILPPKMYGTMDMDEVYEDVVDLLEIFKENPVNPVHFPGEENPMHIKRSVAYKHK